MFHASSEPDLGESLQTQPPRGYPARTSYESDRANRVSASCQHPDTRQKLSFYPLNSGVTMFQKRETCPATNAFEVCHLECPQPRGKGLERLLLSLTEQSLLLSKSLDQEERERKGRREMKKREEQPPCQRGLWNAAVTPAVQQDGRRCRDSSQDPAFAGSSARNALSPDCVASPSLRLASVRMPRCSERHFPTALDPLSCFILHL